MAATDDLQDEDLGFIPYFSRTLCEEERARMVTGRLIQPPPQDARAKIDWKIVRMSGPEVVSWYKKTCQDGGVLIQPVTDAIQHLKKHMMIPSKNLSWFEGYNPTPFIMVLETIANWPESFILETPRAIRVCFDIVPPHPEPVGVYNYEARLTPASAKHLLNSLEIRGYETGVQNHCANIDVFSMIDFNLESRLPVTSRSFCSVGIWVDIPSLACYCLDCVEKYGETQGMVELVDVGVRVEPEDGIERGIPNYPIFAKTVDLCDFIGGVDVKPARRK